MILNLRRGYTYNLVSVIRFFLHKKLFFYYLFNSNLFILNVLKTIFKLIMELLKNHKIKIMIYIILLIFFVNCINHYKSDKLRELQGRYLFLEYYFKSQNGGVDYSVNASGNKTYWIIKGDSIFEEYYSVKNNIRETYYDFIYKLEFKDNSGLIYFDSNKSSFKIINDSLFIENELIKYTLLKK